MSPTDSSLSLYTEEELDEFCSDVLYGACVPFVCDECENIGGYYAASFQEIVCPHCGGTAHPISIRLNTGERPSV